MARVLLRDGLMSFAANAALLLVGLATATACAASTRGKAESSDAANPDDGSDAENLHDGGDAANLDDGAACVPGLNARVSAVLGASWGPACGPCALAQCCAQLTTCDRPDDAGIDAIGFTACGEVLRCTFDDVSGAGAARDGSTDAAPDFDGAAVACHDLASATGAANAEIVVACVRSSCAAECMGF
jgi:hypothetical protein